MSPICENARGSTDDSVHLVEEMRARQEVSLPSAAMH
jgi:hypothetical protein